MTWKPRNFIKVCKKKAVKVRNFNSEWLLLYFPFGQVYKKENDLLKEFPQKDHIYEWPEEREIDERRNIEHTKSEHIIAHIGVS